MTAALASKAANLCSEAEWQTRKECAALYRLVALHGWDDLTFTHVSARVPGEDEHFLINPYGMFFDEITASSLVKIDIDGNILDRTDARINRQGFLIHSTIHGARHDARFVMHLHTGPACAVAAQEQGLLPITQTAMTLLEDMAYHDYEGIDFVQEERERLVRNLGTRHTMLLRNHGTLTIGTTPAATFVRSFFLNRACDMQLLAQSGGAQVRLVQPEIVAAVGRESGYKGDAEHLQTLVWPGLLRRLERLSPGYDE
jgi:ribulose-5-phosphate 4-epimerase/fuculose-1-phosphate aldolase